MDKQREKVDLITTERLEMLKKRELHCKCCFRHCKAALFGYKIRNIGYDITNQVETIEIEGEAAMRANFKGFEYNAPVILTFSILATLVFVIDSFFQTNWTFAVFTYYGGYAPIDFLRLLLWPLGHASIDHLLGNLTFILLIGPMLEEKYGSRFLIFAMLLTTILIGVLNAVIFGGGILGASGIVFMMIIMASFTNVKHKGRIPITFVCVAGLYLGQEVYRGIFVQNQVSEFGHIIGGVVGMMLIAIHGRLESRKGISEGIPPEN